MMFETVEDVRVACLAHNEGCLDPSDADGIADGAPVVIATVRNFTRDGRQIYAKVTRFMAVETVGGDLYACHMPVLGRYPVATLSTDELGDEYARDTADLREMIIRMSVGLFGDWPVRLTVIS